MSHLDILVPFGLPPAEMAADLLRELKTPALATLIARAKSPQRETFDAFSRMLPHETWLARQFGLDRQLHAKGSPPIASAAMQAHGAAADAGVWFMLHPVHFHIARDHLVLTDLRQLALQEQESRTLFEAARPLFDEVGKTLIYGDAQTWFIRADDWHDLQTSTPDAACGHNIDIWMPQGTGERDWRKLQNEVQMLWFAHPVNAEREARGLKPVNSIWLWGRSEGGTLATADRPAAQYTHAFNLSGWMQALGQFAPHQAQRATASDLIGAAPERGLIVLDTLIASALAGDWSYWLERMQELESNWFAPMLAALDAKKIDRLSLILSHHAGLSSFTASKQSLRKFWIKPSLSQLAP